MSGKRTVFGITLTLLYLSVFGAYAIYSWPCDGLKLNEFGDMLAGFVGPVAFLWLILGYLQQGEELRANGAALELQAQELNRSVAEQKAQAEAIKKQVEQDRRHFEQLRKASEEQQHEIIKSQQPILRIRSQNPSWSNGELKMNVNLHNVGTPCTIIAAEILTNTNFKVEKNFPVNIGTGAEKSIFYATFNSKVVLGTISVFYLDPMQRQGRIDLRFANKDNSMGVEDIENEYDIVKSDWGQALSKILKNKS